MYFNVSNFRGRTSAGGDKPWSKNGDKCQMGGLTKFLPDGGTPTPWEKTLLSTFSWYILQPWQFIPIDLKNIPKPGHNTCNITARSRWLDWFMVVYHFPANLTQCGTCSWEKLEWKNVRFSKWKKAELYIYKAENFGSLVKVDHYEQCSHVIKIMKIN